MTLRIITTIRKKKKNKLSNSYISETCKVPTQIFAKDKTSCHFSSFLVFDFEQKGNINGQLLKFDKMDA